METYSLKSLIQRHELSFDASTILNSLHKAEFIREATYLSTTGSGEVKSYRVLTELGLNFGENKLTMHEFKTEPRFYANKFADLLQVVLNQLSAEISAISKS